MMKADIDRSYGDVLRRATAAWIERDEQITDLRKLLDVSSEDADALIVEYGPVVIRAAQVGWTPGSSGTIEQWAVVSRVALLRACGHAANQIAMLWRWMSGT